MLVGHPRYQPKRLMPYLDYDITPKWWADVEIAALQTVAERGRFNPALITPELQKAWREIPISAVDELERTLKHDIHSFVHLMKEEVFKFVKNQEDAATLCRFIHLGLTSFDVRDTADVLMHREATKNVILPLIRQLIDILVVISIEEARTVQIGRTHLQHAEPITFGFGLTQVVNRLGSQFFALEQANAGLVGKISGAVGAYNALSLIDNDPREFEICVLARLGLNPAMISTQILPPEPMATLYHHMMVGSQVLANMGRNFRRLRSTEIDEIGQIIDPQVVGSSTMPHKSNPVTEENEEGQGRVTKAIFGLVADNLISEHERDLCGSTAGRFHAIIPVIFTYQLERFIKYFDSFELNYGKIAENLAMTGDLIMAEPLYILLQLNGYPGDAHEDVKQFAIQARNSNTSLISLTEKDEAMKPFFARFTEKQKSILKNSAAYIGIAPEKVEMVCDFWRQQLD